MRRKSLLLTILAAFLVLPALEGTESNPRAAQQAGRLLEQSAKAAYSGDWNRLLDIFFEAHTSRELDGTGRLLFYQGALIAVENLCSGKGDDLSSREPLRLAFLAGKYSGLAQRHLYLAESTELSPVGWGARLADESASSYYFLGRLIEIERSDPSARKISPAEWLAKRNILHLVFFAAALRHWLGLDGRLTAETATTLDKWLTELAENGISLSFDYLRDLATSPGLRDASVPGDAPIFYRVTKPVDDQIVAIARKKPDSIIVLAASERYAFPDGFRWLEPAGLAMEHLKEAGGLEALDNIREQLQGVRSASRPTRLKLQEPGPDQGSQDG